MNLNIDDITKNVRGRLVNSKDNLDINGVSTDSRNLIKGNLFIPLVGESYDGHNFFEQAYENGCVAAVWQENVPLPEIDIIPIILVPDTLLALQDLALYYRKIINPIIIGVTGSNGKTTTKDIIYSILNSKYKVHKTKGNLNNHIGVPLTILAMPEDTEVAVIEMGMSNIGEVERLSVLSMPDFVIITNVGESHIEYLLTRENIAKAKLEILKGLKFDGCAILPGDEPLIRSMVTKMDIENIIWVGKETTNDVYPLVIKMNNVEGITFIDSNNDEYYMPLLGIHNVINTLMAIEIAKILGVEKQNIQLGLTGLKLTSMRLEKIYMKNECLVLNDAYNASPTSMKAGLELLASLTQFKHKVAVLGDMLELGDDAKEYHEQIGKICADINLDYLIVTGEFAKSIIKGAMDSGLDEKKIKYFKELDDISEFILKYISPQTAILIKGSRGVKLERVIDCLRA